MSFTLRQVTRRAGSGEIVRTRRLKSNEAVIGRGADCDIALADLAVSLRHAVLRQTGPDSVAVESLGDQPFRIEDSFEKRVSLRLKGPVQFVFGSHSLILEPGAEPGEIIVAVAAMEEGEGETAAKVGSVARKTPLLGKRRMAWTLLLAVLAACLIVPIGAVMTHQQARLPVDRQWSSGHLSKAHAFLEDNCEACHQQAFVAVRDQACLSCHQADAAPAALIQAAARSRSLGGIADPWRVSDHADHDRLLHAAPLPSNPGRRLLAQVSIAFNHRDDRCASCHLEHNPSEADPKAVNASAGPALVMTNDCADCHTGMSRRLKTTVLRDAPDWASHPDFRPLVVQSAGPAPRTARVPAGPAAMERTGLIFPHNLHLSQTGGVARMAQTLGGRGYGEPLTCQSCHRPDRKGGFLPLEMERDCSACHSLAFAVEGGVPRLLPHGEPQAVLASLQAFYGAGSAAAATQARRAFSAGGVCFDCHTVTPPAVAGSLAFTVAPVRLTNRYLPAGAFDHRVKAHIETAQAEPACADCHKAVDSARAEDLMLPSIASCATCHVAAPGKAERLAGAECKTCHSYHSPGTASSALRKTADAPS